MNALLLADRSPALRLRALTELSGVPADDPEVADLRSANAKSPEVARALALASDGTYGAGYTLCRLAYLRYDGPEVSRIAEGLFERQRADGSWPLPHEARAETRKRGRKEPDRAAETYTMVPVQAAIPLRGLAAAGYATDERTERGYEWLLRQRQEDGAWPGSTKGDLGPGTAPGYRRLPRSTGCRSSTTGALASLALHPQRRTSEAARLALDHLLARGSREQWTLGWEIARLLGVERASGQLTFYATFDPAFLLDLASCCGVSPEDVHVAELVEFLEGLRGPYGLWEHPRHPQLSRWLTLDLDASLHRLGQGGDWVGSDLRVKFRPYPARRARF